MHDHGPRHLSICEEGERDASQMLEEAAIRRLRFRYLRCGSQQVHCCATCCATRIPYEYTTFDVTGQREEMTVNVSRPVLLKRLV